VVNKRTVRGAMSGVVSVIGVRAKFGPCHATDT